MWSRDNKNIGLILNVLDISADYCWVWNLDTQKLILHITTPFPTDEAWRINKIRAGILENDGLILFDDKITVWWISFYNLAHECIGLNEYDRLVYELHADTSPCEEKGKFFLVYQGYVDSFKCKGLRFTRLAVQIKESFKEETETDVVDTREKGIEKQEKIGIKLDFLAQQEEFLHVSFLNGVKISAYFPLTQSQRILLLPGNKLIAVKGGYVALLKIHGAKISLPASGARGTPFRFCSSRL